MRDPDIGAIVLRGPAGAGKSALAEVLAAEAMADGALVGSRKYAEGENQSAFRPVVEALAEAVSRALSQLYDPAAGLESLRQALGPGLAVLGQSGFRVEGLAILAAREIAGERQAAVRLVSAALRAVDWLRGFGLPILLLLDDWRRSGPQGRRLFMALLGRAAEANLRLVLTERDDLAPDPLASRADVLTLEIGELGTSDRLALFAQRLESEEAAATVVDWLGPDCPSLPFDILQAAEAFQAGGAVRRTAGGWRLDPRRVADLHRPDLVRGLVRRLQDLPERARRTALALGLWGDEAPVGWLAHALGCDGQELDAATVRLQGIGLVRRQGETLQFRHDRLRQGVLDAGGPAERRAIASQMADRLGDAADAGAGEVLEPALHLRLMGGDDAGLSAKWRGRFARGAAEARARVDGLAADRYAEAAFRLRERPPLDRSRRTAVDPSRGDVRGGEPQRR
jgi:hypothetical protein